MTKILTISFGLLSFAIIGCVSTTSQEAALMGLALQSAAINNPNLTPEQAANAAALSNYAYATAQHEAMKEAARERSNYSSPSPSIQPSLNTTAISKPVPQGKMLLGKVYYPKGTLINADGSLYVPNGVLALNGRFYPASRFNWINANDARDLRVKREISQNTPQNNSVDQNDADYMKKKLQKYLRGPFLAHPCNYYEDFNNDGKYDPREFIGIKDKFKSDEKIMLVSYHNLSKKGDKWIRRLLNKNGEEIHKDEWIQPHDKAMTTFGGDHNTTKWLVENGGFGNFVAVYYLNDNYVGSVEFEIIQK